MEKKRSRRDFLKKSAAALGAVVVCDLTGIVGAGSETVFKAAASEGFGKSGIHLSVKLWPGRSERIKQRLADAIAEDVVDIIGCGEESVSVSIEDVSSSKWKEKVYDPEIRGNMKNLYKRPGYSM